MPYLQSTYDDKPPQPDAVLVGRDATQRWWLTGVHDSSGFTMAQNTPASGYMEAYRLTELAVEIVAAKDVGAAIVRNISEATPLDQERLRGIVLKTIESHIENMGGHRVEHLLEPIFKRIKSDMEKPDVLESHVDKLSNKCCDYIEKQLAALTKTIESTVNDRVKKVTDEMVNRMVDVSVRKKVAKRLLPVFEKMTISVTMDGVEELLEEMAGPEPVNQCQQ